jgi:hypothetical protein
VRTLWRRLVEQWSARTPRERMLLGVGSAVALLLLIQLALVGPLQARLRARVARAAELEGQLRAAERLATEAVRVRGVLERAQAEIASSEKANLFTLLETLAAESGVKDRIESINPKQGSANPAYRETRVEVALTGATLEQVSGFLHRIENAPTHLIVHSLRLKAKGGSEGTRLDARFSVSSFERL